MSNAKRATPWFLLVAVACSGAKPPPPTTTGSISTGLTTGLPTGTGTPGGTPMPEICNNGVDDDLDGLLDCEDEDCATDNACVEQNCFNAFDDDGDGLTNCEDEDCWGSGCSAVWIRLTSASAAVDSYGVWNQWPQFPSTCAISTDIYFAGTERAFSLQSPTGVVRFLPAGASTPSTCTWTATGQGLLAYGATSYFVADLAFPDRHALTGLTLGPGCPGLAPSVDTAFGILDDLSLDLTSSEARLVRDGQVWARAPRATAFTWSVDTTHVGSGCNDWTYFWHREGVDLSPVYGSMELSEPL